jgi:hypothetical protein
LDQYNDPELTKRTVLFDNLKQCGGINRKYDASVIAQTMADILDARAWEDYLDVDGSRKSCPSFAEWLDRNGVDIELAEHCIKKKKREYLAKFYEVRDGALLTNNGPEHRALNSALNSGTTNEDRHRLAMARRPGENTNSSYYYQRLKRDSETDTRVAEVYQEVCQGSRSITSAAVLLGWKVSPLRSNSQSVISQLAPQAKPVIKGYGLVAEDFCKIAFHHALQTLTPELIEQYKSELLDK